MTVSARVIVGRTAFLALLCSWSLLFHTLSFDPTAAVTASAFVIHTTNTSPPHHHQRRRRQRRRHRQRQQQQHQTLQFSSSSSSTTTRLFSSKAPPPPPRNKKKRSSKRSPSKVSDPDGPTPELPVTEPELVNPDDIPELVDARHEDDLAPPVVPHQPWRRGDTAGCEAPIAAPWRRQAADLMTKAANLVGAKVLDVTWFLTAVLVTIDPDVMPDQDFGKAEGPPIRVVDPEMPSYKDPADPNPDDIWDDEDEILYQRETPEEIKEAKDRLHNSYAPKDPDDDPDEPHVQDPDAVPSQELPLYMNEEPRDHVAMHVTEEAQLRDEEAVRPFDVDTIRVDTAAISTIAKALLDALETEEDRLKILSRHELVLTSPGPPDVLETQRQFDAYRDHPVIVETVDPFDSNRTLKGRLVDRNAMDLIINKQGRMVTIPLNFVKCVRLPANLLEDEEEEYEEDE